MEQVLSNAGLLSDDVRSQLLQVSLCVNPELGRAVPHAILMLLLAVQGKEYWALERRLCTCMQSAAAVPEKHPCSVSFTEHEVLKASEQKSFDYRVRVYSWACCLVASHDRLRGCSAAVRFCTCSSVSSLANLWTQCSGSSCALMSGLWILAMTLWTMRCEL